MTTALFTALCLLGAAWMPSALAGKIQTIPSSVAITDSAGKRRIIDSSTYVLTGPEAKIAPQVESEVTAAPKRTDPAASPKTQKPSAVPDMTPLLPRLKEALKSGDISTIRTFLKENPGVAEATFVDGSLKTNALNVAISEVPQGDQRIETFRLLVKNGAKANFVMARDPRTTYNAVSYPENRTPAELDFLLGAGADPNLGVCVPRTPPLLSLCTMYLRPESGGTTKISQQDALDRIKIFMKHNANPAKEAAIPGEVEFNGAEIKASSAAQLAVDSGSPELKAALGIK